MAHTRERNPAPWLFGITVLPYGVYGGFVSTAMPFLLRKAGLPVDRIAEISALALIPAIWYFLWSPLVDVGLRRRTWLVLCSAVSAVCLCMAMRQPLPSRLGLFTTLIVAGSAINMLVGAANGGLMALAIADSQRGRAGGWYQAGNVGGGAFGAGVTLWLAEYLSINALAYVIALMMFLPSLAALLIHEPNGPSAPGKELAAEMLRDLKTMFRSRKSLAGLAIFLSPMGAAAAANLFSGIGVDYRASAQTVLWITGFGGAVFTALGSLAGGWICDRMSRSLAYALAALLSAACAAAMMLSPFTQITFAICASFYLIVQGISFAAFSALALELVGPGGASAATRYTLYGAASNAPLAYMTWLDGQGYKRFGPRGLLGTDALSNIGAAVLFLFLIRRTLFAGKPQEAITK